VVAHQGGSLSIERSKTGHAGILSIQLRAVLDRDKINSHLPWSVTFDRVAAIDHDSAVPPYRQLAAILRGQIESGELAGRMPGEKTLMQEYGLALGTVRKAVKLLRDEGLIETVPGWGSYTRGSSGGS
jgi:Bacterial regulatory proteins, gntR family